MDEYQKERLNKLMRSQWESMQNYYRRMRENPTGMSYDHMAIRASECLGYANGIREKCEILGYSIHYVDGCPQIV